MFATFRRSALFAGLALAMLVQPAIAQDASIVSLEEALDLTGVADDATSSTFNPRIVGPRAESEAAQALVGQARLRPNPEVSLEVENIAGSGAFSGLSLSLIHI